MPLLALPTPLVMPPRPPVLLLLALPLQWATLLRLLLMPLPLLPHLLLPSN